MRDMEAMDKQKEGRQIPKSSLFKFADSIHTQADM